MKLSEWVIGSPGSRNPDQIRTRINSERFSWVKDNHPRVQNVEDLTIIPERNLKVRIYTPFEIKLQKVICYFHGGGFVIGGLNSHDNICARLCARNSVEVFSVDYRQGPEFRFPAAQEDALASVGWLIENIINKPDGKTLILAGDSAGGNLAAYAALEFHNHVEKQILIYPVLDFMKPKPYNEIKYSFFNSESDAKWYAAHYLNSTEEKSDPRLSLLQRKDLGNSPPALLIAAESDVLKFEARAFAEKLNGLGKKVILKEYEGMIHGFLSFPKWAEKAELAFEDMAEFIPG